MTEKEDRIDFLLRSLTRIGQLSSEEKLIELQLRQAPERQLPRKLKERTIKRLEERQKELSKINAKIANPEILNSLGEYLKLLRKGNKIDLFLLAESAKTEMRKIRLLEEDRISPLDFPCDEMARLVSFVGLARSVALSLIRKSHQLFKLRPQLEKASARYDQRMGTSETQLDAMNSALKELLLRSAASSPELASDAEMDDYLRKLESKLK
jgi:hypothetical protein